MPKKKAAPPAAPTWVPPAVAKAAARRVVREDEVSGRHDIDLTQPVDHVLTEARWLSAIMNVAFFDQRRLQYSDGTPRPVMSLDDDTACALMGLEIEEVWSGRGEDREITGVVKKYKQADRLRALELLGKYKRWLVERQEHTGPDGKPIAVELTAEGVDAELNRVLNELKERTNIEAELSPKKR